MIDESERDGDDFCDDYDPDPDLEYCARCCNEGMVCVCIDDMCRGMDPEGCGDYDKPYCYAICPDCKGETI